MAASYPTAAKSFTTRSAGDTIQPAHVNDLQDEVAALETALVSSGLAHALTITSALAGAAAVTVPATGRIYLDGASNTYLVESAADTIGFVAGGTESVRITATLLYVRAGADFAVDSLKKVYVDGAGDTFLWESAANELSIVCGGSTRFRLSDSTYAAFYNVPVYISATSGLYLDGGGNTYISEASADVLQLVAGGNANLTVTSATITINGQTVSFGANDSGGTGYRLVRVPNT